MELSPSQMGKPRLREGDMTDMRSPAQVRPIIAQPSPGATAQRENLSTHSGSLCFSIGIKKEPNKFLVCLDCDDWREGGRGRAQIMAVVL